MNITPTTTPRAGLALGCALLACAYTVEAKPKVPPPPDDPPAAAYDFVSLDGSSAADINEAGLIVGSFEEIVEDPENPFAIPHLTLLVPEEENGSQVWWKDADLDGRNDLLRDLGTPPGMPYQLAYLRINDHGLMLMTARFGNGPNELWILAPRSVDGGLTWTDLDGDGVNWQMAPLPVFADEGPQEDLNQIGINNHGEVALVIDSRGYVLAPSRYEVSPEGAVTVEYPAADLDGDGLNDYLIDLGIGVSAWVGQNPPLLPAAINDQGDIAGVVEGPDSHELPFVIRPRQDENGGLIWNEDSDGDGVNDLAVYLPLPEGDIDSDVYAMNDNGTIVGWVLASYSEGSRGAIWQVDWEAGMSSVTRLGTALRDYDSSSAKAVNAVGQVVGSSLHYPRYNPRKTPEGPISSEKAWLVDQGEMVLLADLVAPETGLAEIESRALGITDSGLIIGHTRPVGSHVRTYFILIPAAGE